MTNTQSPAPGVAAEAQIDALLKLADDYVLYSGRPYSLSVTAEKRIALESALRTALQASAAAVEPVEWEPLEEIPRERQMFDKNVALWGVQTTIATCLKIWGAMHPNGSYGAQCNIMANEVAKLYTAPPLPAQVQAAELSDELIIEAFAEQDLFLIHHQPGEHDRIPECGIFSDVTVADVRKALAYLASRTPAPGMAGGVGAAERLQQKKNDIAWAASRTAAMIPGANAYNAASLAVEECIAAILAAPHPSPAPQAAGAEPTNERWIVVNEVVVQTGSPRPELAYAVFEGSVIFPSFQAAAAAITELGLPLGWVAMELRRLIAITASGRAGS